MPLSVVQDATSQSVYFALRDAAVLPARVDDTRLLSRAQRRTYHIRMPKAARGQGVTRRKTKNTQRHVSGKQGRTSEFVQRR